MTIISDGNSVYFIHSNCPEGGHGEIEAPDEHIEATLFTDGAIIPERMKCICGGTMILLEEDRSAELRSAASERNARRFKEYGWKS